MAALWGGGAGHSGAGGTLPMRGTSAEPLYSLPENLHLATLETETILEAGEFLETMQDYLDSSVITIIEDFNNLTETKSHMDAENELSLLAAITDILDSTDDESLSPFDPIPESELLTSPGEHENVLRFRKLSVTLPEHSTEDFQQPRPCTVMTEKVQTSATSLPFRLTSGYSKESISSNKASSKEFWKEQKLFKHRERELPMLQRSDGEEEEEEIGCKQSSVAGVKEIPVTLAAKESEKDLDEGGDPYVIAPENISLSELVRSVHSYCQPTFTVCVSSDCQPLAEEIFTGPVVLEIVPDGEESKEIPVVLHDMEIELPSGMDINAATSHINSETAVLAFPLGKEMSDYKDKSADLDRELDSFKQDERVVRDVLQNIKGDQIQIDEETQKSTDDQKNKSEPALIAKYTKLVASNKDQISVGVKRKKKYCKKTKCQKTIACRKVSACVGKQATVNQRKIGSDFSFQKKKLEEARGKEHGELLVDQVSEAKETLDDQLESAKCVEMVGPKDSFVLNSESAYTSSGAEESQSVQCLGNSYVMPIDQGSVQGEPHENSQSILPAKPVANSKARFETSQLLPSCTVDLVGQPSKNTPCLENQEVACSPKETKPRPLSLTEYRQRRQQHLSNDDKIQNTRKNQNASKWPSVPKPPTELADLPCLIAPLPSTRAAASKLVKEPEKPASSSTALATADKSSAIPLRVLSSTTAPLQREVPPLQLDCVNVVPSSTPISLMPPRKVCAFSQVGTQVPPTLSVPHVSPAPEAFVQASLNPYNLGSSRPPWPSWSPFPTLPANFQSLPPPPLANEAPLPVFHTVPPLPPPSWPPPPVPLPFVPGLPYGSAEWAPRPPSSYWPAVSFPPPTLPFSYGDQGGLVQSSPVGILPTSSLSAGPFGQQTAAFPLDRIHIKVQNTSVNEKQSLPVQVSQMEAPSVVRRVSDPRRKAQPSTIPFSAEVITSSSQPLEKPPSSVGDPSGQIVTQNETKSSDLQSIEEPQQVGQFTGIVKSFEKESTFQFEDKNLILSDSVKKSTTTMAQSNKLPEKEHFSSSISLAAKKQTRPTEVESEVVTPAPTADSSLESSLSQKIQETGHFKKRPSFAWKRQPFIRSVQSSCNKDIVQAFISEIGIEASDLCSLLEQFEKTEAINEASTVKESRRNVSAGSNCNEAKWEKKMDQLHAPELINVAGLTPPATPPHHLWKPLAPASLLGKDGTQKEPRLLKSLSKPHKTPLVPVHVGSGEHDYCQLSVAQPKGGARWNVKKNLDITIKPIKTITKQKPDQPILNQPLATSGLNSTASACHNSKETPNPVDSNKDQTKDPRTVRPGLKPTAPNSVLLKSSLVCPHKEVLDHRTTNAGSVIRGIDHPCSVLLSPAASPCWDSGELTLQQPEEVQQKPLASRYSSRCYRGRQRSASPKRGRLRSQRNHASQSFSSSSDGDSDSSLSSSSSSSRSRSRSPPSKRWRRSHSRSSSSSSCEWSRSRGRSRSSSSSSFLSRSPTRSPSLHRRNSYEKRFHASSSFERYQRQKMRHKERAIEERRVVFIGKLHSRMTRSELQHRFSVFGDIEDCTLHFREQGDNYGFVTYRYAEEAFAAIKGGHALLRPDEQPFDLCFGGRRQFCERNYVDLDSNLDDFEPACMKNKSDTLDFGTLLKQAQQRHRR